MTEQHVPGAGRSQARVRLEAALEQVLADSSMVKPVSDAIAMRARVALQGTTYPPETWAMAAEQLVEELAQDGSRMPANAAALVRWIETRLPNAQWGSAKVVRPARRYTSTMPEGLDVGWLHDELRSDT